jgi:hypothetical protein
MYNPDAAFDKGAVIAALVALAFKGQCGAFGEEDGDLKANCLALGSQCPVMNYIFNEDGSIDTEPEDAADYAMFLTEECGMDDSTDDEITEEMYRHYDSLEDLVGSDDTWFMEFDRPDIEAAVKLVLEAEA